MNKLFLAGKWTDGAEVQPVLSPFDGHTVAEVHRAGPEHYRQAVDAAVEAARELRSLPAHRIAAALETMGAFLAEHAEEATRILAGEAGKPIKSGQVEVQRSLHIVEDGVEECKRLGGESLPLDRRPWGEGRFALVERFPRGVMAGITPFNFPLHLVAHKIVPAVASRNAIVIKPASQTPLSALMWGRAFAETDLPPGTLSILPGSPQAATALVEDTRVGGLSFTGSPEVGWELKARAARKHVALELGGNAAAIVHSDAELDAAAQALTLGAFATAGQSCISTQRVYLHQDIYDNFTHRFVAAAERLIVGDPMDPDTDVGPVISQFDAQRIEDWIGEAKSQGAQVLTGDRRQGNLHWPTVLTDTRPDMKVNCREVFGPVVTLAPYEDFDTALELVNDSEYGLQAGVFTRDVGLIHQAYSTLEVGGVMINAAPTWRIDHMPYGGVKSSGEGREGVRYAMQAMTEPRLLVINLPE
ncbi:MAG: aldehyde dehydrogenase family protein [Candidatus Neomarinimicrobiota bacterium]